MRFDKIQAALRKGCRMHGVVAVNGKVIISIVNNGQPKGYGEDACMDNALIKANHNLGISTLLSGDVVSARDVPYVERIDIIKRLDGEMRQGLPGFLAWCDDEGIHLRLIGSRMVCIPKHVLDTVMDTKKAAMWHTARGYSYETSPDPKNLISGCISTVVRLTPKGEEQDDGFAWAYPIVKIGSGKHLWAAIDEALHARELEVRP